MTTGITCRRGTRRGLVAAAVAACASLASGAAAAAHGELDLTFADGGRRIGAADAGKYGDSVGWAIAQSPMDGKLVVAGYAPDSRGDFSFLVLRLNLNGTADPTFGTDGIVQIDFGDTHDTAAALALGADGRIIVAGQSGRYDEIQGLTQDVALAALMLDGTLDPSFGHGGRVILDLGGANDTAGAVAIRADGTVIVAGSSDARGTYDLAIAQFRADGTPDPGFGAQGGGVAFIDRPDSDDTAGSLVMQEDGNLIACGSSFTWEDALMSHPSMLAVRLHADGTLDGSFGIAGTVVGAAGVARDCINLPDGSLVLVGHDRNTGAEDILLERLSPDGSPVQAFGVEGVSRIDLGGSETAQSAVRMADGGIAIVGLTASLGESYYPQAFPNYPLQRPTRYPSEMFFARIEPDTGALDPGFGDNGTTIVDFGKGDQPSWAYGRDLVQQADGKLVAVGSTLQVDEEFTTFAFEYPTVALARVDPSGAGSRGRAGFDVEGAYPGFDSRFEAVEAGDEVAVAVRRTGGSAGELSVQYETVDDTAQSPGDYQAASGTLVWSAGETGVRHITIRTASGASTGQFRIRLSAPAGALAASEFVVMVTKAVVLPDPPTPPANRGGGGAAGAETLLLALLLFAVQRARIGERKVSVPCARRCRRSGSVR